VVSEAATVVSGGSCFLLMTRGLRYCCLSGLGVFLTAQQSSSDSLALSCSRHKASELGIPIAFAVASPIALAVVCWGRGVHSRQIGRLIEKANQRAAFEGLRLLGS